MNPIPRESGFDDVSVPNPWRPCSGGLPEDGKEVQTKVDDENGNSRNVTTLTRHRNLWFFPDMSMYVYYSPTHWRPL